MYRDHTLKFSLIGALCLFALWASLAKPIDLGLDLRGGTRLVYSLDFTGTDQASRSKNLQGVVDGLQRRIDIQGNKEVRITASGENHVVVQLPQLQATEEARVRNILQTSGVLEFKILRRVEDQNRRIIDEILEKKSLGQYVAEREDFDVVANPIDRNIQPIGSARNMGGEYNAYEYLLVENPKLDSRVTGSDLEDAYAGRTPNGKPCVNFELKSEGARRFGRLTGSNLNRPLAICLDGAVVSAPNINSRITSRGYIEGNFTPEQTRELTVVLKSGSLPVKPKFEFEDKVGALLGQEAKESGLSAMLLGFIAVAGFMLVYYKTGGIIANVGLVINLLLLWGTMVIFNFTLTLPGFAGILLTAGMSVDANILVFERIREEMRKGAGLGAAIEAGYSRAFWTIFDANVTTLLTGAILYIVGTGPIRGFALTLCLGIVTSVFSALFVTKAIFGFLVAKEKLTGLSFMQIVPETLNVDFMGKRNTAVMVSIAAIVLGFYVFVARGDDKLGIDFTGGTEIRVNFNRDVPKAALESELSTVQLQGQAAFRDLEIQNVGDAGSSSYLIRTRLISTGGLDTVSLTLLKDELEKRYKDRLAPIGWGHPTTGEIYKVNPPAGGQPGSVVLYGNLEVLAESASVQTRLETRLRASGLVATVSTSSKPESPRFRSMEVVVNTDDVALPKVQEIVNRVQSSLDGLTRDDGLVVSAPFPMVSTIGPAVANVLRNKAILAILVSLVGLVIYIGFRFEPRYGVAAVLALVHDVLITLGAIALADMAGFDVKINLPIIAALLTIIGYSLNDTIVVFDRIRENKANMKKDQSFTDVVNAAINQTMSRTLLTSGTTVLAVMVLLFFSGVPVIMGLSFALICGIVVGTYSSIFVASAALLADRKTLINVSLGVFAGLVVLGLAVGN